MRFRDVSKSALHTQLESSANKLSATPEATNVPLTSRFRRLVFCPAAVRSYWAINALSLTAIAVWIYNDGRFAQASSRLIHRLLFAIGRAPELGPEPQLASRVLALSCLAAIAVASGVGVCFALFLGRSEHRRVRGWLGLTVLLAAWLTLYATWPELSWRGQASRVDDELPQLQTLITTLTKNWPTQDGESSELGAFLAYPAERPQTLLLLTQVNPPGTKLAITGVERSNDGALRLQLAGSEIGSWLEWHPIADEPRAFVGGLLQRFELDRFQQLDENWYLVRYK